MIRRIGCILLLLLGGSLATESLHPVIPPTTTFSVQGIAELDDDIYSGDMELSAQYAILPQLSVYLDGAFRFLGYSYEFSTKGYVHNYCNLHINGFNETYAGIKWQPLPYFGLDVGWRFPPGEGSQKNRFHRLNIEPFTLLRFSRALTLGTAIRYNVFLEDKNYMPGNEIGLKASFIWKPGWNEAQGTGWRFSETALYQARIQDSENRNLAKPYRKMYDKYSGLKIKFDVEHFFSIAGIPIGFGINYEIHEGTLFGFETGHRIGVKMDINKGAL